MTLQSSCTQKSTDTSHNNTNNDEKGTPPPFRLQEMKDRESKRWLLEDFVKENEIRAVELEMAYKRFQNLAPSRTGDKQATSSVEMDFNTWILVSLNKTQNDYVLLWRFFIRCC